MPLKDLLFSFEGRIRRRDWWIWSIGASLAYMVIALIAGTLVFGGVGRLDAYLTGALGQRSWQTALFDLSFLPLLWVQTALAAKRAHDRNVGAAVAVGLTLLSGLLTFVPTGVDLLMGSAISDDAFNGLGQGLNLISGVASLYLLVVLGFLDGTQGPNRFGRSPKGIGGDRADTAAEIFS